MRVEFKGKLDQLFYPLRHRDIELDFYESDIDEFNHKDRRESF